MDIFKYHCYKINLLATTKKYMHITFDMKKYIIASDITGTQQQMNFSNWDFYQLI